MGLTFNSTDARKADNFSSVIRDTGKYIGVITRAEKLVSEKGTHGLGLSFKTDDGATANYLDVYTAKADGELLRGNSIVQALLCCLRLRNADEGKITFERWSKQDGRMVQAEANGYPVLMGKRIGLILQRELQTNNRTGEDVDRINIVAVFEAATGLTSSEILDKKTTAERADAILKMLKPVNDRRAGVSHRPPNPAAPATVAGGDFSDDVPFAFLLVPLAGLLAFAANAAQGWVL